jgi:hypothetical protein
MIGTLIFLGVSSLISLIYFKNKATYLKQIKTKE